MDLYLLLSLLGFEHCIGQLTFFFFSQALGKHKGHSWKHSICVYPSPGISNLGGGKKKKQMLQANSDHCKNSSGVFTD